MKPMTVIFIGAIIVIVGGIIGAVGTLLHNKNSSEKTTRIEQGVSSTNEELLKLRKENSQLIIQTDTLNQKVDVQFKTIDDLRSENVELYTKLANSATTIYENLTGGDSYCYCFFLISRANPLLNIGNLFFKLGDDNKSPLRNINARVVDINTIDVKHPKFSDAFENNFHFDVIEIKKSVGLSTNFKLDKIKGVNLNIFFSANNGFFNQCLRMRFVNGDWVSAVNVTKGDRTVYEHIDKDYPEHDTKKIFY